MSKPTPEPPPKPAPAAGKRTGHSSGRVQFDERGQAVWAWAVQTGMFDRNASTQRVRALSESTVKLEISETPTKTSAASAQQKGGAFTPYDTRPAQSAGRAKDTHSNDPYSRGPAKSPEAMTFNPYDRAPTRRR